MNTAPLHVIYTSQLAPGRDCAAFSAICRGMRSFSAERCLCGVLLFDGERFLQWLCGAGGDVSQLMSTIAADERQTGVHILLQAQLPAPEVNPRWRCGFVDAQALDDFMALDATDHAALFDGLAHLVAQADLDPLLPAPRSCAAAAPRSNEA